MHACYYRLIYYWYYTIKYITGIIYLTVISWILGVLQHTFDLCRCHPCPLILINLITTLVLSYTDYCINTGITLNAMHQVWWPADYLVLSGALGKPCTRVMYS